MRKLFLLVPATLILVGCATQPSVLDSANMQVIQNTPLPAPTWDSSRLHTRAFRIGPLDKLSFQVFGVPELSREELQVDANGQISIPLVGSIEASGKTPSELADAIEQRLREYVRNPQVTVNLVETVGQVVTIDGQVQKPGLYPVMGNMTLMRAIASAGGPGEFADLEDVVVFRTVNGQRMAGLYNLGAIRAGAYEDPEIYAEDTIIVGDSEARRIFKDILQASPLITTPLIILF